MLKNIKKRVLKAVYIYHYHMANYCYKNACWNDRVAKHVNKEFKLVNKLVQLEEI